MTHYIISFIVYTFAMSGLIALALFVYKKVTNISSSNKKTKMLSVEEVLNINPKSSYGCQGRKRKILNCF